MIKPDLSNNHGSPKDRGSADAYYGRKADPHKWPQGTGFGEKVKLTHPDEIEAYMQSYSSEDDRKHW